MNRHPRRHRRSPRRIGAGVEVAAEIEGGEAAIGIGGEADDHVRRVPLRRRHHRFAAAVGEAHRTPGEPGGESDVRLHRQIEFAAEPTADGGGDDAHLLRGEAEDAGDIAPVGIRRLRGNRDLDGVADAPRAARLRLDVGMLDETRLEGAFGDRRGAGEAGGHIPRLDDAADEFVRRPIVEQQRRIGSGRRLDRPRLRQALPEHRKIFGIERLDGRPVGDDGGDRLAGETHPMAGEHRLVAELRRDAVGVLARDVVGGEDADNAGVPLAQRGGIADDEVGGDVGRADDAKGERVGRGDVVAEALRAVEPGEPVEAGDRRADGTADRRRRRLRAVAGGGVGDGRDDLAIAGASTVDAAEGILDLCGVGDLRRVGPGARLEQCRRRHQHPGRAHPALHRPRPEEGLLQRRQPGRAGMRGQPFDGDDAAIGGLGDRRQAGADGAAVEEDGAGAARPAVAADLGAGEAEIVAQHLGQPAHRRCGDGDGGAVEDEAELFRRVPHPRSAPRTVSARRISVAAASRR